MNNLICDKLKELTEKQNSIHLGGLNYFKKKNHGLNKYPPPIVFLGNRSNRKLLLKEADQEQYESVNELKKLKKVIKIPEKKDFFYKRWNHFLREGK